MKLVKEIYGLKRKYANVPQRYISEIMILKFLNNYGIST